MFILIASILKDWFNFNYYLITVYVKPATLDWVIKDENGIMLKFSPADSKIFVNEDLDYSSIIEFDGIHQGCVLTCRDTVTNRTKEIFDHCNDWKMKVQGLSHGREYGFVVTPLTLEGTGADSDEKFVLFPEFGEMIIFWVSCPSVQNF